MFTGIVAEVGRVLATSPAMIEINSHLHLSIGESISVSGVCLTVTAIRGEAFTADLSEETASRTSLSGLAPGAPVNLERPVTAEGLLGGHLVQGHIDGVGKVDSIDSTAGSTIMWIGAPNELLPYLALKGSVAVDGVSLTVSGVDGGRFSIDLIPFTLENTTLGGKAQGDPVNLEADVIAKYVERLLEGRFKAP